MDPWPFCHQQKSETLEDGPPLTVLAPSAPGLPNLENCLSASWYTIFSESSLNGLIDGAKQRAVLTQESGEHGGLGLAGPQTQQYLGTS